MGVRHLAFPVIFACSGTNFESRSAVGFWDCDLNHASDARLLDSFFGSVSFCLQQCWV